MVHAKTLPAAAAQWSKGRKEKMKKVKCKKGIPILHFTFFILHYLNITPPH
jgi:hypothetical protein